MGANNETGVVQPLDDVIRLAHVHGALVFADLTQIPGKHLLDVHAARIDFACFSAHKVYGPKGTGALYKRRGLALSPLIRGGGQEAGLRSGTENVPGIVGFGLAMEQAARDMKKRCEHLSRLTQRLETAVQHALPEVVIHGSDTERIPGTSMFSLPGLRGNWLAQLPDVMAGSGSACASEQGKPSPVLLAMGVDEDTAGNSVRISLGVPSTEEEVRHIATRLVEGARKLRREKNA
jgi:cysteine desulfurase